MAGLIPQDRMQDAGDAATAVVAARWPLAAAGTAAQQLRPVAAPLPAPLLGLMAAALDLGGMALSAWLVNASAPLGSQLPLPVLALCMLLAFGLAAAGGGYALPALFGRRQGVASVVMATAAACLLPAGVATAIGQADAVPGELALLWLVMALPQVLAGRLLVAGALRGDVLHGRRRAVVVGSGAAAQRLAEEMRQDAALPLRVMALVDGQPGFGARPALPHLSAEQLLARIRRDEVDEVLLTPEAAGSARDGWLLQALADCPVHLALVLPDPCAHAAGAPRLLPFLRCPISGWAAAAKAAEDYLLGGVALLVAAVPMALIAGAIKIDSPGPVLFRQRRIGFNNREFHVLKFRTMYDDAADHDVRQQTTAGDPRVTPVGAILRRTSLDELPQILNVLRGEMSFVGPRPHAPGTRAGGRHFHEVADRYDARHRVKPGLTGLAQVRGWRGPTETEEKLLRRVESDLEYIETWSPWLDLRIILRTALEVARMRNAV